MLPGFALGLPAAALAIGGWLTWQTVWRNAEQDLQRSAEAGAEYAARVLYGYQVAAGRVNSLLYGLSDADIRANEAVLHEALKRLVKELPQANASYVIDRHGFVLLSANIFPVPADRPVAADRDFFQALSQPGAPRVHISEVHTGRLDGKLFFAVSRPREGTGNGLPPGQFDGLVNISVEPQIMADGLRKFLTQDHDAIALLRDDRQVLVHTGGGVRVAAPRHVGAAFPRDALRTVEVNTSSIDGEPQLLVRRWVQDLPVYVASRRSRADIVAEWRRSIGAHLLFGIPATLALFLLSLRVLAGQRRLATANDELREALAGNVARLDRIQSTGGVFSFEVDADGVARCDDGFRALYGLPPGTRFDYPSLLRCVHPDDRAALATDHARLGQEGGRFNAEFRVVWPDGTERWLLAAGDAVAGPGDFPRRIVGVNIDVTDRKRAELGLQALNEELESRVRDEVAAREEAQTRLAQAQRMEALGKLAAGIAHDFNNVLQAALGGLALIQRRAENPTAVSRFARMASEAVERGAGITARLLSFARQGELKARHVEVPDLLLALQEMLSTTLGASITVHVSVPPDIPPLWADKGQLETTLVNLAVNARDAMVDGGTLTLVATLETVGAEQAHPAGLAPGGYVRLSVRDTGTGMDAATLARAAEPFFTTKDVGHGTGLGLAMARGFAQQSGGGLLIDSTPGAGTEVTLWLPRADRHAQAASEIEPHRHGGSHARAACVLLVDDDAMVRTVLAGHLEDLGYRVHQASDGLAALARLDAGEVPDVLVTDYAMPGLNGVDLIREARRRVAALPALLLTGYADTGALQSLEPNAVNVGLLRKPVRPEELAERVAACASGEAHAHAA